MSASLTHRRSLGAREAFTLLELLVVVAIIGVLMALLIPAVQSAIEASRRMQCQAKLKQLGVALHGYHDLHGVFPAAADGGVGSVYFSFTGYGRLLPFLEQQAIYDLIDYNGSLNLFGLEYSWASPANTTAYSMQPSMFLCPSAQRFTPAPLEVSLPSSKGMIQWVIGNAAVTDYLFCGGADRVADARFAMPERMGLSASIPKPGSARFAMACRIPISWENRWVAMVPIPSTRWRRSVSPARGSDGQGNGIGVSPDLRSHEQASSHRQFPRPR
ncbi:MAG: DUF1559 domain-containing protein [Planctomycetota bacterium]